ncbi:hypothetical protein FKP32DRAFT_895245 [Trametes sanguinea]|nr:hypothetical protein FKP32DRAFT_895245 [Trametes sanguinea]
MMRLTGNSVTGKHEARVPPLRPTFDVVVRLALERDRGTSMNWRCCRCCQRRCRRSGRRTQNTEHRRGVTGNTREVLHLRIGSPVSWRASCRVSSRSPSQPFRPWGDTGARVLDLGKDADHTRCGGAVADSPSGSEKDTEERVATGVCSGAWRADACEAPRRTGEDGHCGGPESGLLQKHEKLVNRGQNIKFATRV